MAGGQCHSSGGCATGSERGGTLPPLLGGGVQGLGVGGVKPAGGEEKGELGMGGCGGSEQLWLGEAPAQSPNPWVQIEVDLFPIQIDPVVGHAMHKQIQTTQRELCLF